MENGGGGILGRLGEKILGWIALGLLLLLGFAIWQMEPATRWAIWNGIWRTIVWVLLAVAVPWGARPFVGRALKAGTNWAGAALIAVCVCVDAIIGLVLLRGWPAGGWGWLAALAALAVAGTYNYLVTEYLAEQAGG
jgi:hypothetical protein